MGRSSISTVSGIELSAVQQRKVGVVQRGFFRFSRTSDHSGPKSRGSLLLVDNELQMLFNTLSGTSCDPVATSRNKP